MVASNPPAFSFRGSHPPEQDSFLRRKAISFATNKLEVVRWNFHKHLNIPVRSQDSILPFGRVHLHSLGFVGTAAHISECRSAGAESGWRAPRELRAGRRRQGRPAPASGVGATKEGCAYLRRGSPLSLCPLPPGIKLRHRHLMHGLSQPAPHCRPGNCALALGNRGRRAEGGGGGDPASAAGSADAAGGQRAAALRGCARGAGGASARSGPRGAPCTFYLCCGAFLAYPWCSCPGVISAGVDSTWPSSCEAKH